MHAAAPYIVAAPLVLNAAYALAVATFATFDNTPIDARAAAILFGLPVFASAELFAAAKLCGLM